MLEHPAPFRTGAAEAAARKPLRIAERAAGLAGSEILRIAAEIRALRETGAPVTDFTVGDFDPRQFRLPPRLEQLIAEALAAGETNYPPSIGLPVLREAVCAFYERELGLRYPVESVLVTSGSRPGLYGTFRVLLDPGDRVVYGVPSWNNNYYCYITGAVDVPVPCGRGTNFLPDAALLAPAVRDARMLVLNSPINPTGSAFDEATLRGICDLVLEENARRGDAERPLYLLYDHVYWTLTFGGVRHVDPVSLRPEIAKYTIYVDGISKAFAATGVRVGWVVGPADIIAAMNTLLQHVGTWAPRAEQVATARFLGETEAVAETRATMVAGLQLRLRTLVDGLRELQRDGLPVESTDPMGAMYVSARFAINGKCTVDGQRLGTNDEVRKYLLERAGFGAVPFQGFGVQEDNGWFRLSVGAVSPDGIVAMLPRLRAALEAVR